MKIIYILLVSLFLVACCDNTKNNENETETILAYFSTKDESSKINIIQISNGQLIPNLNIDDSIMDKYNMGYDKVFNTAGEKPKNSKIAYRITIFTTKHKLSLANQKDILYNLIKKKKMLFIEADNNIFMYEM